MKDNVKEFAKYLSENKEVAQKIDIAGDGSADYEKLSAIARENGFDITAEDFKPEQNELDADELKNVAGGLECTCVLAGGGTESDGYKPCACVTYGEGNSQSGVLRCQCIVHGSGDDNEYRRETPFN